MSDINDIVLQGKSLGDSLGELDKIEQKIRTVRTPENAKRTGRPVGARYGKDSGMITAKGSTIEQAAKRLTAKVTKQRGPKQGGEPKAVTPAQSDGTPRVRFQGQVTEGNRTFWPLDKDFGSGYIGKTGDDEFFFSFGDGTGDNSGWAADRQEAAATVAALALGSQISKSLHGVSPIETKSMSDSEAADCDGLSAGQMSTYKKLRGKKVTHKVALKLAKNAK